MCLCKGKLHLLDLVTKFKEFHGQHAGPSLLPLSIPTTPASTSVSSEAHADGLNFKLKQLDENKFFLQVDQKVSIQFMLARSGT